MTGGSAKYPLAIVAKIIETHGKNTLGGYDIGCSFETTVKNSSLGPAFLDKNARFCVPAFHGYTHNHVCQLQYHPNIIDGIGIEDFETMERIFSASNQLASVTRYASPYRRRLLMETFFKHWDDEKYANLGVFLLGNYTQALKIIDEEGAALDQARSFHDVDDATFEEWAEEELKFFAHLGEEEEEDIFKLVYVEALQKLQEVGNRRASANSRFLGYDHSIGDYNQQAAHTREIETERRYASEQYERVALEVNELEVRLGIDTRWTPVTPEYKETVKYLQQRRYQQALLKLQRLVVQRLFELHKLNMSQTSKCFLGRILSKTYIQGSGYNMRTSLAKSLQVRCKTIRRAVTAYNSAALAMEPPRPTVDWTKVSHYQFLEEFTLLQDTRNDVRAKEWARPEMRATIKLHRRVERAKEELVRLNVEARRLHTAILDEDILFDTVLKSPVSAGPLRVAMEDFVTRRRRINAELLRRLRQIYELRGFTGVAGPGIRLGSGASAPPAPLPVPSQNPRTADEPAVGEDVNAINAEVEEEIQEEVFEVVQYIGNLVTV